MSTAKDNSCRKFQANIFNKSKCQNCFKPRELHLLTDQDLNQAKPIYGGWLCLAPEGTDFSNPMQRSRKWQRRFFVLYEHGCLRFALDESSSTLPQGTVNLNLCTDVIDAEPKTGQKNALCIITPEQEYFIRGENKEIINGWTEQLVVYPRTNKQNQKKKRKVEPTTSQEPGPAKVAVKGSGIPEGGSENVPDSSSIIWQEELSHREAEGVALWPAPDLPRLGSPQPSTGDCGSVARGSDAGSVNGDEVDRSGLHGSVPLAHHDLLSPTGSCSSLGGVPRCFSPLPSDPFPSGSSLLSNGSHISGSVSSLDSDASGNTVASTESHLAGRLGLVLGGHHDTPRSRRLEAEARKAEKRSRVRSPGEEREAIFSPEKSRSGVIEKLEALELENPERMEVEEAGRTGARQGRSERRRFHTEEQRHDQGLDFPSTLPPLRRAKSLDRRTTESVMTPDLLNFKKGWMVKLDEHGQWTKFWFVLTDHSLQYYKDSIAEEASDLDGEIDLSTCYNVTEYQAQRNYGFQIHTREGLHTLSAMTAGIRRNWIQAVMKNVRPSTAPDVASNHGSFSPLEGLVQPDVTQDSPSSETSSVEREPGPGPKKSRARERRQQGRSKTFDWGEFRPIAQALAQQRAQKAEPLQTDIGDPDRNRRREERRRRYESVTGSSKDQPAGSEGGRMDFEKGGGIEGSPGGECVGPPSLERQQKVEVEIEQRWQQVEQTPIRDERRVTLPSTLQTRETAKLEKLLESYKKGVEELKLQLGSCHQQLLHSNQHKQNLEVQLRTALEREQHVRSGYVSQLDLPLVLEADIEPQTKRPELVSSQAQSLARKYQETKELLQLQELKKRNMQAQLGLSLSHLSIKELYLSHPQTTAPLESLHPSEPLVKKTVSFLIEDSADRIQELEDLISGKSLTLKGLVRLLRSHSEFCLEGSLEIGQQGSCQRLLESWKFQQEVDNETITQSLARAGESIHSYESRLLAMEDMLGRVQKVESQKTPYGPLCQIEDHSESHEIAVQALFHRVELLKSENGALNQRYQEIVNQLTEADREIDRLKAELINLQGGKQHLLILEELNGVRARLAESQANAIDREFYERELNEKSVKLHEALVTLEVLGSGLKDGERRLQLKEATLKALGFQMAEEGAPKEKGQLKEQLEATGAKLLEKENLCRELQTQNVELQARNQESERVQSLKLLEAENEIRMLRAKLGVKAKSARGEREVNVSEDLMQTGERKVADKSVIKQVVGEIKMKSDALSRVLEVLVKLDVSVEKTLHDLKSSLHITDCLGSFEEEPDEVSQRVMERLVLDAAFWSGLLNALEVSPCETEGERVCSFEMRVVQRTVAEKSMLMLMNRICPRPKMEVDNKMTVMAQTMQADLLNWCGWLDNDTNTLILKDLTEALQEKVYLFNLIASTIEMSTNDTLLSLVLASFDSGKVKKQWSEHLQDAATEAHMAYLISRLNFQHEKELKETQVEKLQIGNSDCASCFLLGEQNRELQSKLADQQNPLQRLESTMSEDTRPVTHIQLELEPIDSLDKAIQLQDMVAKHKLELRETNDVYTQVTENLRQEVAKVSEILRLEREENVKEIDSLTVCMENLKKKHETERIVLLEKLHHQMDVTPGGSYLTGAEDGTISPETSTTSALKERIQELVAQVSAMTEEMKRRELQGDAANLRLKYDQDLENLKATCERGFAAMEESHQRVIEELQRKNQRALENLHEEKERLLAEETAATIAAIEAMKNAHRSELEKELDKARKSNSNTENADIEEICRQHEEELCSFQREIEVLSEQYSQKCLENAHLAQALEAERQALRQCQRENQELNAHNQELNNRLAAEITKMRSMATEDGGGNTCNITHGKELYELEVMLRVKESEVQYLKQEINSLRDELQAAQRDKKYATDKYKDIYTELSIVKAKAERDLGRLREQLQLAHEALGEPSLEEVERAGGYDIMKSKSNPDILKMAAAAAKRTERIMRSKSLKEGLTAEQRLHLFDKDTKEF
ncbi:myosin phosphatase Rho-interacting protein isoform X1 [Oncorhynchus tshawytscha]|uniref:myosin phosphatase Rho-interacting protein isoform X1 n=1 Tax=Oncorhynchus tshawytscha TaxID=74940 RepID=UPI001C3C5639|nr:myosin phosphatase Rho-interacting protein isoform X1 [Oncorhynchus tshawytscha]